MTRQPPAPSPPTPCHDHLSSAEGSCDLWIAEKGQGPQFDWTYPWNDRVVTHSPDWIHQEVTTLYFCYQMEIGAIKSKKIRKLSFWQTWVFWLSHFVQPRKHKNHTNLLLSTYRSPGWDVWLPLSNLSLFIYRVGHIAVPTSPDLGENSCMVKRVTIPSVDKDVEQLEPSHFAGGSANGYTSKNCQYIPQLNICITMAQ